jgi:hypothetical protein
VQQQTELEAIPYETRGVTFRHPRSRREYGVILERRSALEVDVRALEVVPMEQTDAQHVACFVMLSAVSPSDFYARAEHLLRAPVFHATERNAQRGVTLAALLP